ncbi:MAG: SPOR domain-containing protein [Thiobacillaceae bacterium]|nr:SPOR domain-containing protein [Thiobacillaceae bacterium]MCX7672184.1 SPOR domain-containing protein [Thiobacillaceae bacterium]MDW8324059.1 SPOR domain-containing protein [Burkholderiales bacterium]
MAQQTQTGPSADGVKRRALTRLAIAGGVTLAALAGLWWLERAQRSDEPPAEAQAPAPIVSVPQPAPPQPAETGAAAPPEEVPAAPAEPPPPPKVGITPAPALTPAAPDAAPAPPTRPMAQAPAPARPAPAPAAPAPPPAGRVYVLQLGVFTNPDNAKQLVERLAREGIRAHTETRVQVGPFASRAEAEAARAALERLGLKAVIGMQAPTR